MVKRPRPSSSGGGRSGRTHSPGGGAATSWPKPSTPAERQAALVDETTRLILRTLRRRVDAGAFDPADAVDIALQQILRPGGPRLNVGDRQRLSEALKVHSKQLSPPSSKAIYEFAKAAAAAAWINHQAGRSPGASLRERTEASPRSLIQAAIAREAPHAKDSEDLLRRAVNRALRERRRGAPGVLVPLDSGDPLRGLLDLPTAGRVRLPRGEIRGSMARAAVDDGVLGGILRQAAVFSSMVMQPLLGEALWRMCRPIGFADRRRTKVLVAAPTSVMAQEVQLHSRELLHRLQQLPALKTITGIRVVVDDKAYHLEGRPTE